jgi:PPOX class probable F420-dependent enzyme
VADLGKERFVSLTTLRRDGTPVATPVWVVVAAGLLYVWTGSQTGKAKRIRNNPGVTLAPCTRRGTVTGAAVPAQAVIVSVGERPEIWRLFAAKYGLELRAIVAAERLVGLLRLGRSRRQSERIYVELAVTAA